MSGANTNFTGTLHITNGARYDADHAYNLPGTGATVNIDSGGQLYFQSAYNCPVPVSIAGVGYAGSANPLGLGTMRFSGGTLSGNVTLTANASVTAFQKTGLITGNITGPYQLELRSGNTPTVDTLTLAPSSGITNSYGSTRINNSFATANGNVTLVAGNAAAFSSGGMWLTGTGGSVSAMAILKLNGYSFSFANLTSDNAYAEIENGTSASTATITVGSDGTSTTYYGTLIDGGTAAQSLALTKVGSGTLTLAGSTTFSGNTLISAGTLALANALALQDSTLDTSGAGALNFTVNVATLGGLTGPNNLPLVTTAGHDVALSVGTNGQNTTYSGVLSDVSGSGSLTKIGTGALTLTNGNTYGGGTTLSAGLLVAANGMTGSALGSGTLTLTGGTLAAGAAGGSINGPVVAGSSPHVIAPGAGLLSGYGTLNLNGGLSANANTTLLFNLGAPVANNTYNGDLINLGGPGLSVSSGTGGMASISFVTNPTAAGDYRLFGGTLGSPILTNFSLPAAPVGETYSLTTTADTGFIDVAVTPIIGTWVSANGSGSWGQGSNWTPATVPTSGTATFAGAPTQPITVTLDGNQSVGALVFSTSNGNGYTLANGIGGPLSLGTPSAASVAVLSGTHKIAADIALAGNLGVNEAGGGVLELSGNVSDGGAGLGLTLTGNGELVLSGTGSYGGPTAVDGGTMYLTNSTALPAGSPLIVGAGGTFIFDPSQAFAPVGGNAAASPHGIGAVPEPGTLALVLAGLVVGFAVCRRRKGT
jgi:autotransporter-associated beta strand protein